MNLRIDTRDNSTGLNYTLNYVNNVPDSRTLISANVDFLPNRIEHCWGFIGFRQGQKFYVLTSNGMCSFVSTSVSNPFSRRHVSGFVFNSMFTKYCSAIFK